ncbi:MAG: hypothetical protein Q9206_000025 [Seirophora lacunosa]
MAASEADDDDLPKLPADTLAALGEFYSEREQNEKRLENLKAQMEQQQPQSPLSMKMFMEDWNASQFWQPSRSGGYRNPEPQRCKDRKRNGLCVLAREWRAWSTSSILASELLTSDPDMRKTD